MIAEDYSFDESSVDSNTLVQKKKINKLEDISLLIKRRVRALKKLIVAQVETESKFNAEVHLLKCKYQKEYEPFFNKRREIIQGKYDPTKKEYGSSSEEDGGAELVPGYDIRWKMVHEAKKETVTGIPNFWLIFTKNSLVHMQKGEIQPHDVPILRHLTDIRVNRSEKYIGYTMEFYFTPNEWFTNNVLVVKYVQTYLHKIFYNIGDLLLPLKKKTIFVSTGCEIHWNEGKNVTETVKGPSYFNLFGTYENITKSNMFGYFNHEYCEMMIAKAVQYYLDPTINDYFSDGTGESDCLEETD